MGRLTRYGRFEGVLSRYTGTVFYVAPSSEYRINGNVITASDDNPGDDPVRPLRTIARAHALCTANAGDVIACYPGTHTLTASLAMSKAGVSLTGLDGSLEMNMIAPRTTVVGPSGDQAINVTAANVEISRLRFTCITAITCIDFSLAADFLYIHDCSFDMSTAAASTSTVGIGAIGAASRVCIDKCYFDVVGGAGPTIDMTATLDSVVQYCTIQHTSGTQANAILVGAATDRLIIQNCDIQSVGTLAMTCGIDGTGANIANGVSIHRCIFGKRVTVAVDNFDAGEAQIANNYTADNGTPGGTLIVAIT